MFIQHGHLQHHLDLLVIMQAVAEAQIIREVVLLEEQAAVAEVELLHKQVQQIQVLVEEALEAVAADKAQQLLEERE